MAKRVFKMGLNANDIKKVKQELINIKDVEFPAQIRELVTRLAKLGIPVIERQVDLAKISYDEKGIQSGSDTEHQTYLDVNSYENTAVAKIVLKGRDVLFIEFGAGVYYNTPVGQSPHPQGREYGYLIGTYGLGNGAKQVWGYYDEKGELVLTRGTKATMPMHEASLEIARKVVEVAREVFG